jgi:probable HAF family extracellular repeat protein
MTLTRSRRRAAAAITLPMGFLACSDAVVEPSETLPRPALVPGEYWEVTTLLTSDSGAWARDVNDAGTVVGTYNNAAGASRAFRHQGGVLTQYPPAPGTDMTANSINASGQATGGVAVNGVWSGYVRQANGTVAVLPHHGPAGTHNFAYVINDGGLVAGTTENFQGVRWSPAIGGWGSSSIGVLLPYPVTRVHGINNSGWIVGSVSDNVTYRAFVQMPGQAIQTITGLGGNSGNSAAFSVNNSGRILGGSTTVGGDPRYFSWTSFGGSTNEAAIAHWAARGVISDRGRIAGVDTINGRQRAFTVYQGIHNVLPFVPNGWSAMVGGINSCGAIVGTVRTNAGGYHAVRWRRVVGNPPFAICD